MRSSAKDLCTCELTVRIVLLQTAVKGRAKSAALPVAASASPCSCVHATFRHHGRPRDRTPDDPRDTLGRRQRHGPATRAPGRADELDACGSQHRPRVVRRPAARDRVRDMQRAPTENQPHGLRERGNRPARDAEALGHAIARARADAGSVDALVDMTDASAASTTCILACRRFLLRHGTAGAGRGRRQGPPASSSCACARGSRSSARSRVFGSQAAADGPACWRLDRLPGGLCNGV